MHVVDNTLGKMLQIAVIQNIINLSKVDIFNYSRVKRLKSSLVFYYPTNLKAAAASVFLKPPNVAVLFQQGDCSNAASVAQFLDRIFSFNCL